MSGLRYLFDESRYSVQHYCMLFNPNTVQTHLKRLAAQRKPLAANLRV